jgi:hypothetical protein
MVSVVYVVLWELSKLYPRGSQGYHEETEAQRQHSSIPEHCSESLKQTQGHSTSK